MAYLLREGHDPSYHKPNAEWILIVVANGCEVCKIDNIMDSVISRLST